MRKTIALLLAIVMVTTSVPFTGFAETVPAEEILFEEQTSEVEAFGGLDSETVEFAEAFEAEAAKEEITGDEMETSRTILTFADKEEVEIIDSNYMISFSYNSMNWLSSGETPVCLWRIMDAFGIQEYTRQIEEEKIKVSFSDIEVSDEECFEFKYSEEEKDYLFYPLKEFEGEASFDVSLGNEQFTVYVECVPISYIYWGIDSDGNFYAENNELQDEMVVYGSFEECLTFESVKEVPWFGNMDTIETVYLGTEDDAINADTSYWFQYAKNIEKVYAYCTRLDYCTFEGCEKLLSCVLSDELSVIGTGTFMECESLESIKIPDNVKTIGGYAFADCHSLDTIVVPDGINKIKEFTFINCTQMDNVDLPDSVIEIDDRAFDSCTNLKTISWPKSLQEIYYEAFLGTAISDLSFPEGLTIIGDSAFSHSKAESMTISGGTNVHIGWAAFYGSSFSSLDMENFNITEIPLDCFSECTKLSNLVLPKTIEVIGEMAFHGCCLKNLLFPDSLRELKSNCFSSAIKDTTLSTNKVEIIGPAAFCYNPFTEIDLSDSVRVIDDSAFWYCTDLNIIHLGSKIESIGAEAFGNCHLAKELYVDDLESYLSINYVDSYLDGEVERNGERCYPFNNSTLANKLFVDGKLATEIDIPASISSINKYAFKGCNDIKTVRFNAELDSIGCYAFPQTINKVYAPDYETWIEISSLDNKIDSSTWYQLYIGDEQLKDIVIPEGIVNIPDGCFARIVGIDSVTLSDSIKTIGNGAFSCSVKSINFNEGLESIGEYAFSDGQFNTVSLPSTLRSISKGAFSKCNYIEDVYYYGTETERAGLAISETDNERLLNARWHYSTEDWDVIESGDCTEAITWKFRTDGTLLIEGTGALPDYSTYPSAGDQVPWKEWKSSIKKVVFSDGITYIGNNTLYDCYNLESASIPGSVETVGNWIFTGCSKITSVGPAGSGCDVEYGWTKTIPGNAFQGLRNVNHLILPGTLENIEGFGGGIYGCADLKTVGPMGGDYDIEIGWEEEIPSKALNNISSIESVVLPDGIKKINAYSIDCSNLKHLYIPGSVTEIADWAYNSGSILSAGPAGSGCDLEYGWTERIPAYAFGRGLRSLETVIIADGITELEQDAFYLSDSAAVKKLVLPGSLKNIKSDSFASFPNLKTIGPSGDGNEYDVAYGWTDEIPDYAFYSFSGVTDITIRSSITRIGENSWSFSKPIQNGWFSDLDAYLRIDFGAVPGNVYVNGELLVDVVIPSGITSLDNRAFYNNKTLESISIPDTVTSFGGVNCSTFSGCSNLQKIKMPVSISDLNANTFWGCSSISEVEITPGTGEFDYVISETPWKLSTVKKVTVSGDFVKIPSKMCQGVTNLESFVIGESVKEIGDSAFSGCASLKEIVIPDTVEKIGSYAFGGCTSLKTAVIGNKIQEISGIFAGCSALESVTLPITAKVSSGAFSGTNLKAVTFTKGSDGIGVGTGSLETPWKVDTIESITFEDGVKEIPENMFAYAGFTKEPSVHLSETVTTIGKYAFYKAGLSHIDIPASAVNLGDFWLAENEALKKIGTSPEDDITIHWTDEIPKNAFVRVESITNVSLSDSITKIGESAFFDCNRLEKIVIPDSVVELEVGALSHCDNLKELTIPVSAKLDINTKINYGPFNNTNFDKVVISKGNGTGIDYDMDSYSYCPWHGASTVVLSEGIESIGNYMFYHKDYLENIIIPDSVESIGESAFAHCYWLESITLPVSALIGENAFQTTTALKDIKLTPGNGTVGDTLGFFPVAIPESVKAKLQEKKDVDFVFKHEQNNNINSEDKAAIDSEFSQQKENFGEYFEASLWFESEGRKLDDVLQTNKQIEVNLTIPEWAKNKDSYEVIRVHEGKVDRLPATCIDGVLTFMSDKFSSFAYVYKDSQELPDVIFDTNSITLGDEISVNFKMKLSGEALDDSAYMKFTISGIDGKEETQLLEEAMELQDGRKQFCYKVSAIQMADTITATYHYGNKEVSKNYSVREYIEKVISLDTMDESTKALVKAIADYGYYAQISLSETKGWRMGVDHAQMIHYKDPIEKEKDLSAYRKVISGNVEGITKVTQSLVLDSKTSVKIYLAVDDSYQAEPHIVVTNKEKADVSTAKIGKDGSRYYVEIPEINAHMLGDPYTISVDNSLVIKMSALSYAEAVLASDMSDGIKDAVMALSNYYDATIAYKNAH